MIVRNPSAIHRRSWTERRSQRGYGFRHLHGSISPVVREPESWTQMYDRPAVDQLSEAHLFGALYDYQVDSPPMILTVR